MGENLDKVKLSKIKKCVTSIEEHFKETPERLEDIDITFEYIIGSFFPEVLSNIRTEMSRQYIEGFKDGSNLNNINYNKKKIPQIKKYLEESLSTSQVIINHLENAKRNTEEENLKEILTCLEIVNILQTYLKILINTEEEI